MDPLSGDGRTRRGGPPAVRVRVIRSGGIAGIRREWSAEADEREAPRWVALIRDCPWDDRTKVQPGGVDRFTFTIHARCGQQEHAAELGEQAVRGPWRALIDEVRQASAD